MANARRPASPKENKGASKTVHDNTGPYSPAPASPKVNVQSSQGSSAAPPQGAETGTGKC